MAKDLYEELGVPPTADTAAIRRAYRKKAKSAHPDVGGSPEAFNKLTRALAVLTDPRARSHYDKTGEVEEPGPDLEQVVILELCIQALLQAAGQSDTDKTDLVKAAKDVLRGMPHQFSTQIRQILAAIANMEKVERRLKRNEGVEGPDHLRLMVEGQIAGARRAIRENEEKIERAKKALKVFDDYYYEFVRPQPRPTMYDPAFGAWLNNALAGRP